MKSPVPRIPVPGGTAACRQASQVYCCYQDGKALQREKNLNCHYLFHTILLMYQPEVAL